MTRAALPPHQAQHLDKVASESLLTDLTPRQMEVLKLVAEGLSNKQIASRLAISHATVENHLHTVFGKLGVGSRTEAAVIAVMGGVLSSIPNYEGESLLPFEV